MFKNGRSMMAKADNVYAYIERHSSKTSGVAPAADAKSDPYGYEAFAGAVRAKRLR